VGNRSNPSSKRTRQRISILYEEHVAAGGNDASSGGDPVQDKKKQIENIETTILTLT